MVSRLVHCTAKADGRFSVFVSRSKGDRDRQAVLNDRDVSNGMLFQVVITMSNIFAV